MNTLFLNRGLYTVPEAHRLTGVSVSKIRRWLGGYWHGSEQSRTFSNPVWESTLFSNEMQCVDFLDLVEIRVIDAITKAGVPLLLVRTALERARTLFDVERPFSSSFFRTDGQSVFLELQNEFEEAELLDLIKNQYAMKKVIEPSFTNIEFSEDIASRWWPMSRKSSVLIDPKHAFGAPVVDDVFVPTSALANSANRWSVKETAKWFDVPITSVRDAVKFENRLASGKVAA